MGITPERLALPDHLTPCCRLEVSVRIDGADGDLAQPGMRARLVQDVQFGAQPSLNAEFQN
jgi:hypothetical protein